MYRSPHRYSSARASRSYGLHSVSLKSPPPGPAKCAATRTGMKTTAPGVVSSKWLGIFATRAFLPFPLTSLRPSSSSCIERFHALDSTVSTALVTLLPLHRDPSRLEPSVVATDEPDAPRTRLLSIQDECRLSARLQLRSLRHRHQLTPVTTSAIPGPSRRPVYVLVADTVTTWQSST